MTHFLMSALLFQGFCWFVDMLIIQVLTLNLLVATLRLLITFVNSLDPDQARQNVGPDLGPNFLPLRYYSRKKFLKKLI